MNKCDFEYDQESFSEVFKRQADSADAALRKLWAAFDCWPEFANKVLQGKLICRLGLLVIECRAPSLASVFKSISQLSPLRA